MFFCNLYRKLLRILIKNLYCVVWLLRIGVLCDWGWRRECDNYLNDRMCGFWFGCYFWGVCEGDDWMFWCCSLSVGGFWILLDLVLLSVEREIWEVKCSVMWWVCVLYCRESVCEVVCNFCVLRCGSYVVFVDFGFGLDEFFCWLSWML